jgi:hypothetical protein
MRQARLMGGVDYEANTFIAAAIRRPANRGEGSHHLA